MASDSERRNNTRFAHESPITIEDPQTKLIRKSKMFNYSETGLYFEADLCLEPGTIIYIGLKDSPLSTPPGSDGYYRATIKWRRNLEESFYAYGYGVNLFEDDPDRKPAQKAEARNHKRRRCALPTRYGSQEEFRYGLIENISRGGVFVKTNGLTTVGQRLVFEILLEKKGKIVKIPGQVIHSDEKGFGVEFPQRTEN